ncbi:winged helix DNA-binding domain-containing protein [Pseudonocardia endophytica]|uniref:Winged helix DNA-binding protein n=1 Tax=Pseudonocardia endophytica TaxID=401976 RepID=A0A4R1I4N5_PSEEN|nr:winged helix DNA-binding domain-containing protein [Pseudonocardia endophytica]TCK24992.1 winged helix DNA-binding protein [Pseudonocardia endophytica]
MTVRSLSDEQRRARLVTRHRLAPTHRTDDVVAITDGLVGLHSTDPVTVYLSAAARMASPDLGAVDRALYEDRTLLRHHAMRRTLWVFGRETARLAHHAATADVAAVQRRKLFAQLTAGGVADPPAWLEKARSAISDVLRDGGPLPAREVGPRVPDVAATEIPIERGVHPGHTRALLVMGFDGQVLRARPTGSWINGQYRWADAEDWVPGGLGPELSRREAAEGLARAYLRAFGPATRDDLRWWAGWTVATMTAALADTGAVEVALDGGTTGFVLPDDVDDVPDPGPSVALLPGLDPTTMGWKARDWHLDPAHVSELFDRNGNGGPAIWVDGQIAGGWVQRPDGEIAVRLLADIGSAARDAVDAAAHELSTLLGDVRFSVRFPAPMQPALLAGP